MQVLAPICYNCLWKHPGELTCEAFPEGIPDIVLMEGNEHKEKLPGQQNGIVFEQWTKAKEQDMKRIEDSLKKTIGGL